MRSHIDSITDSGGGWGNHPQLFGILIYSAIIITDYHKITCLYTYRAPWDFEENFILLKFIWAQNFNSEKPKKNMILETQKIIQPIGHNPSKKIQTSKQLSQNPNQQYYQNKKSFINLESGVTLINTKIKAKINKITSLWFSKSQLAMV